MTYFTSNPPVQHIANADITATQVVRTTTSGRVVPATTSLQTLPFDGLALSSVSSGSSVSVQLVGPIDPNIFNLGGGVACAVGVNATGFPVRATNVTCVSSPNWIGHCDAAGTVTISSARRGFFDPIDFGAVGDGLTDDLSAFQALHLAIPTTKGANIVVRGAFYLSDTWRVSKQIRLKAPEGQIDVAPGRSAIRFDGASTSLDGNDAAFSVVDEIKLNSRILIHGTANGSALGRGIGNFWNSANALRKNDCVIASSGNTGIYFRCTNTGNGNGIGSLGSEPTWNTTIGGTTSSGGLTFITESFPTVRANLTLYTLGQRVFAVKDNRVYWECETAGTTAASPPAALLGGDLAAGFCIGGTVTDGSVVWRSRIATGILVASTFPCISNPHVTNFTGPGLSFVGGEGQLDGPLVVTDVNFFRCKDSFIEYCGVGIYAAGDNANGWNIEGFSGINLGTLLPTPNVASGAGFTNLGGHCIHDSTLGGGAIRDAYFQLSTGRSILKTGLGRTSIKACVNELDPTGGQSALMTGTVWIDGGNITPTTSSAAAIVSLDPNGVGRGIAETDATGARTLVTRLTARDGFTVYSFSQSGDVSSLLGWRYNWAAIGTGWWGLSHGSQNGINAIGISEANAVEGPGLWADIHGHFSGTGNRFWHGADVAELTTTQVRGGSWIVGDRWNVKSDGQIGSYTQVVVKIAGYRGAPWQAIRAYSTAYAPWGIFADQVEPTNHDPTFPTSGGRVFQCTVSGISAGVEPNWASIPNTNDTIVDGTVTWKNVGTVAEYNKVSPIIALNDIRTTTISTSLTVADHILSIGTLAGNITVTLPASPTTGTEFIIKDSNGSALAFTITIAGNGHNIDGSANYVMSSSFQSVTVKYNGTVWMVL